MSRWITAISWRGQRQGAAKMASPRNVKCAAQGFAASQVLAAREMRRRLTAPMADRASSRVGLTFTSTKAIALAPDNDIDLAAAHTKAKGQNMVTFKTQHHHRRALGQRTEAVCFPFPLNFLRMSASALACCTQRIG
jgi:hypothetical protein